VERNIEDVKRVLANHEKSVVMSMAWHTEFNRPKKGMLPTEFGKKKSGHAVECIGFDDTKEIFIFQNSWGQKWGDKGYFYMPYEIFTRVVWDCWCSLDIPQSLPVDRRYGEKRTWAGYVREKGFAFNSWLNKKIGRLPNNREINALAYGFWDWETVFTPKNDDVWLYMTKPDAIKKGKNV